MSPRLSRLRLTAGLALMIAGSALSMILLRVRVMETELPHFQFLAWNLFLAWVPMLLALAMLLAHRRGMPGTVLAALGVPWLLFLPNAPYLVTDVIHLRTEWGGVPPWFDVLLVGSAAATGLLIGYGALYTVHVIVSERYGTLPGWLLAVTTLPLTAVGVYLGRVLRFNSWDAVIDAETLFDVTIRRASSPLDNPFLLAAVAMMTVLLIAGYVVFLAAAGAASQVAHGGRRESRR